MRRTGLQKMRPRRLRRSRSIGTSGSKLSITAFPPSTFQNGVASAAGATVRLVTSGGQPILLAGVLITAALVGTGATLSSTPATATTDANGVATFTSFTLTGTALTYGMTFTATGYTPATSTGHQLLAGPASASKSTADVADGQVGVPTVVTITLRDSSGNPLTVAGASAVTVQVTGANPIAQTTVPFASGYSFSYTPGAVGTDTILVKYGGTSISGSPYTSVVSTGGTGFTANSLRVAFNNNLDPALLGTGPTPATSTTWSTAQPIFRIASGTRAKASLETACNYGDDNGITILATMPGARTTWTDAVGTAPNQCHLYNDASFRSGVDAYAGSSILESAMKRRRLILYGFDEPWIDYFCDTVTPYVVKMGCRYIKANLYADVLIACRIEPQYLRGAANWHTGIMPDGVDATALPVNYFDKMDYAWATFRGSSRTPSKNQTPLDYYTASVASNLANGYGTFCAHNWANLGDADCWKAFNDTRDGRIHGDESKVGLDGQAELCSVAPVTNELWVESPARIRECIQAAAAQPAVPACMCYIHPGSGLLAPVFTTLFQRPDYVAEIKAAIGDANARSTTFTWRTPK